MKPAAENSKIAVTEFYPILMAAINLFFIPSLAGFTVLGGFRKNSPVFKENTLAGTDLLVCQPFFQCACFAHCFKIRGVSYDCQFSVSAAAF